MGDIKVIANRSDIVAVADAIRNRTGNTNQMTLNEMISNINKISTDISITFLSIHDDGNGNITVNN